jgi:predicted nucleic acid-binding protein
MRQITQLLGGSEDARHAGEAGRNLFGSPTGKTARAPRIAATARHYDRNLVTDIEATGPLDNEARAAIQRASSTLHQSLNVVVGAISGRRDVTYTRSSALFGRAERDTAHHGPLPIRDLKLIDATMAEMAELMGLPITDYDTIGAA